MKKFHILLILVVIGLWPQVSTIGLEVPMNQDWSKLDFTTAQRLIEEANVDEQFIFVTQALRHQSPEIQLQAAKKMNGQTTARALNTFVSAFDDQPAFTTGGTETDLIHRQFLRQLIVNMAVALKRVEHGGDEIWEKSVLQEARAKVDCATTHQKDSEIMFGPLKTALTSSESNGSLQLANVKLSEARELLVTSEETTYLSNWYIMVLLAVATTGLMWTALNNHK